MDEEEVIPVKFILRKQKQYEKLLEYDLYESDEKTDSKYYYMKLALIELLLDWKKKEKNK